MAAKSQRRKLLVGFVDKAAVLFLLTVSTLLPTSGHAECGLSAGAEWIYFSPRSESFKFAELVHVESVLPNQVNSVSPVATPFDRYFPGYRVYASLQIGCFTLGGRYTHLKACKSSSVTAASPSSFIINPFSTLLSDFASFASQAKCFRYEAGDALLQWQCLCNCLFSAEIFGGVHYAYLSDRSRVTYVVNISPSVSPFIASGTRQSRFDGAGPELGVSLLARLPCGFGIHGAALGGLVIGKHKGPVPFSQFDLTTGALIGNQGLFPSNEWRTVPFGDIRLGISYTFCLPFLPFIVGAIEGGYEGLVYYEGLLNNGAAVLNFRTFRDVIMHGPYISVVFGF